MCWTLCAGVRLELGFIDMSMRDEFEKWISGGPYEKPVDRFPDLDDKEAWPGQYRALDVQLAWEAWQAARASEGGEAEWLIQMVGEYRMSRGNWERPDHRGYTNNIHEAGRYSEAEAKEAERMMPYKCTAVRLPVAHSSARAVPEDLRSRLEHLLEGFDNLCGCLGKDPYLWGYSNAMRKEVRELLTAAPTAPAVEGGGVSELQDWLETQPEDAQVTVSVSALKDFLRDAHPHNGEQGGEWVRCDERLPTDADWGETRLIWYWEKGFEVARIMHFVTFYSDPEAEKHGYWMPTGLKRPAPPTEREDGHE